MIAIELTNVPSEGIYSFRLYATASDCKGNLILDGTGSTLTAWVDVQFEGDHVDIGGGYAADAQSCGQGIGGVPSARKIARWPPVNYPPPELIIEYIRDLVASGNPLGDEILLASKIAHGNSFYRAMLSPSAREPELLKENADLTATGGSEAKGDF